ncbi:MAG: restriction endonuclease [Desulfococcaceae bacterium]
MAIPDYQTMMLPLLQFCGDGKIHNNSEAIDHLADLFSLTEKEIKENQPSGRQTVLYNRATWALFDLKKACLLENKKRGVFLITSRGLNILKQKPKRIDIRFLKQFPEYSHGGKSEKKQNDTPIPDSPEKNSQTPEEQLEDAYENIRESLASEILEQLKTVSPDFFERIIVEVIVQMGYGGTRRDAGQAVGRSGDGGIDGIIKEDRLGLDIIYLQAKRWQGTVGRPEIQKFAGALQGQRAKKGIFITTSDFTKEARDYAAMIDSKIVLIDGKQLAQYMIDFSVGVTTVSTYEIKKLDSDYFTDE